MNQQLLDEYFTWSKETFGEEKWIQTLKKLKYEELDEFKEATIIKGREQQAEELADCFFLLFKIAYLRRFTIEDIEAAMAAKLIELHNREYKNGKRVK